MNPIARNALKLIKEYGIQADKVDQIQRNFYNENAIDPNGLIAKEELYRRLSYLTQEIPDMSSLKKFPDGSASATKFHPGTDTWAELALQGECLNIPFLFHLLEANGMWKPTVHGVMQFTEIWEFEKRFYQFLDYRINSDKKNNSGILGIKKLRMPFEDLKKGYDIVWEGLEVYIKSGITATLIAQYKNLVSKIEQMASEGKKKINTVDSKLNIIKTDEKKLRYEQNRGKAKPRRV